MQWILLTSILASPLVTCSLSSPLPPPRTGALDSGRWSLLNINHKFDFSPTYPAMLVVPVGIDPDLLLKCRAFRSKGAFPRSRFLDRALELHH